MATASCSDTRIVIPEDRDSHLPPPEQEGILAALEKRIHMRSDRSKVHKRIDRFPHNLRGIGGTDDRYVVPSVVAIGPYHHDWPHLQAMEEIKHAAARSFCRASGCSVSEIYKRILSLSEDARGCYIADNNTPLLRHEKHADFTAMLFLDGCFLIWIFATGRMSVEANKDPVLVASRSAYWYCFVKDIFLLENQIPFLVLEALGKLGGLEDVVHNVNQVIDRSIIGLYLQDKKDPSCIMRSVNWIQNFLMSPDGFIQNFLMGCGLAAGSMMDCELAEAEVVTHTSIDERRRGVNRKPPHLLWILRSRLMYRMPKQERCSARHKKNLSFLCISALDLAKIGVKLTASTDGWFAHVKVQKKLVSGELSLSPLFLNDTTVCNLVNMVAFEEVEASMCPNFGCTNFVVTTYLLVLAMIMNRDEDIQELRARGVLRSQFSDMQTLAIFKGLAQNLRLSHDYLHTILHIQEYMRHRPVRIAVHKFIYNNFKVMAAVLSIAGVLVGIFKALYSLKRP